MQTAAGFADVLKAFYGAGVQTPDIGIQSKRLATA
jgi:hypothetical protein